MKLRTKVFISILLIAITPTLIVAFFTYNRYTHITRARADEMSDNMFQIVTNDLNDTINDLKDTAGLFTFYSDSNFSIVENLKEFSNPQSNPDPYAIMAANQNIKFICQNVLYSHDYIYGLYVFTPSGAILSYTSKTNGDILPNYDPTANPWYIDTMNLNGSFYISSIAHHDMFTGQKESLFLSQSIYDVYSHEFLGMLVIDCSPSLFEITNNLSDITLFRVTNNLNNSILYTNENTKDTTIVHKNIRSMNTTLSLDSLTFTAEVDYDALYKEFKLTGILIFSLTCICIFAILVISLLISKKITEPIVHLSKKMAQQNGRSLTTSTRYFNRNDEIGTLYNEFNNMIEELNSSIWHDYQAKLITLDAQMKSLEARINSHFLFNTLESINSIAEIEDSERIATMSLALGNMFRYSIKTPSELVTISDELNHVKDYVAIQSIRFDNRFHINIQFDDTVLQLKILKLILQPLVENAFYHGLKYCTSGDQIDLIGEVCNTNIIISVKDNGIGMTQEQLTDLQNSLIQEASFTELGHRNNQSIGLKNIQTRIELYYGRGYGLHITSEKNIGTQIQIVVPIINKEDTCTHTL